MDNQAEREAITEAIARLFAGTPIRSSGSRDIVTLAQEAGVKRNKLTHKHTDLRDAFYAERARRAGVSEREIKLREQTNDLTRRLNEVREERDNYRAATEVFARAMNVLTRENADLRKRLDKATSSNVMPIRGTRLTDRS
jgi:chromosome segregation ATPase